MAVKATPSFDPKTFLAKVGEGRSIVKYPKDQTVFSQGEPADDHLMVYEATGKELGTPLAVTQSPDVAHCDRQSNRSKDARIVSVLTIP